jgi:thiol:disulfide interchange protein DsbA
MLWIKRLLIPLFIITHSLAYAEWGEGWDPVDPPVTTSVPEGKVEVIEFFWYGCPHCYIMEPELKAWLEKKPDNVVFKQVPTPLNDSWTTHAQFYYAAEVLGVIDQLHLPLFEAIHDKKEKIYSKQALIDFAVKHGVDRQKFSEAWNSFGVYVKVQQASKLGQRYALQGVPAVVVDGKYKTSGSLAGTYSRMFEIVDELVTQSSKPAK